MSILGRGMGVVVLMQGKIINRSEKIVRMVRMTLRIVNRVMGMEEGRGDEA